MGWNGGQVDILFVDSFYALLKHCFHCPWYSYYKHYVPRPRVLAQIHTDAFVYQLGIHIIINNAPEDGSVSKYKNINAYRNNLNFVVFKIQDLFEFDWCFINDF